VALDLVCLGNLSIDDVVHPDGTTQMETFGGDAIYATIGASFWTGKVKCVAPIGTDFPARHLEDLRKAGFDTRGLPTRAIPNVRYWVVYEYDGRRTWIFRNDPNDFYLLAPTFEDIPLEFRDSKAFLLLGMELVSQEQLVPQLKNLGGIIALDSQEDYIAGNQERIFKMLANVDIFLPSQVELEGLVGHKDYPRAARQLAAYGPRIIVIKMGGEGSIIFDRIQDRFWKIPIYPTRVQDSTGAGDAYCGGFMASYVRSGDLVRSGLAGAVSASYTIEGFGLTHMFKIDPREGEHRLQELIQQYQGKLDWYPF
jgi:ribokinase